MLFVQFSYFKVICCNNLIYLHCYKYTLFSACNMSIPLKSTTNSLILKSDYKNNVQKNKVFLLLKICLLEIWTTSSLILLFVFPQLFINTISKSCVSIAIEPSAFWLRNNIWIVSIPNFITLSYLYIISSKLNQVLKHCHMPGSKYFFNC